MQHKDTSVEDKREIFAAILEELRLKLTHQRLEIFDALVSTEDHPSAEEVYEKVKSKIPAISFDTVYRTLALFERYGVIAKAHYLDDRTRYDSNMAPHYHLVCKKCKRIQDFSWPDLDELQTPDKTRGGGFASSAWQTKTKSKK